MNYFDHYKTHFVYLCSAGSRAYGLQRPDSDYDVRGVYIAPTEEWLGLGEPPGEVERKDRDGLREIKVFELKKFVNLALKANPNILEMLWTKDCMKLSDFDPFIKHRAKFLSKRIADTYFGYATSQLHKMRQDVQMGREIRWKHAAHLIRLMRSGIMAMHLHTVPVRVDAKFEAELRNILAGFVSFGSVMKLYDELADEFRAAESTTILPDQPDQAFFETLVQQVRAERLHVYQPCDWKI